LTATCFSQAAADAVARREILLKSATSRAHTLGWIGNRPPSRIRKHRQNIFVSQSSTGRNGCGTLEHWNSGYQIHFFIAL